MFEANAVFKPEFIQQSPARLWKTISPQYSVDESALLAQLADLARPDPQQLAAVTRRATDLVEQVRATGRFHSYD